jgi:N-acyl-L-homoserine lactone synthetase
LRYQVYCVENHYLDGDELEVDQFDLHSHHVIVRDNVSGEVVGTVRLVLWQQDMPEASFPMQQVSPASLRHYVPLRTTAEVSRFAISKARRDLVGVKAGLLRLLLVQGVVRLSAELGITHWVAVMEPSLLRLLKGSGIHFNPIGNPIEYHGLRQCCYAKIDALLARVYQDHLEVWGVLTGGGTLWPAPGNWGHRLLAA